MPNNDFGASSVFYKRMDSFGAARSYFCNEDKPNVSAIYLEEGGKTQEPETDRSGFPGREKLFPLPVQGLFFAGAGR